jgi:uncharacterized protein (TIGR03790 family)
MNMGAPITVLVCLCVFLVRVVGADTGDSVVLVYNSNVPASKQVAEYYAAKRQVPAEQVLSFALPETENISRSDFESKLERPLWNELRSRMLMVYGDPAPTNASTQRCNVVSAKVRYIVLCYGVPLKIDPDPALKEAPNEKLLAELKRNEAAVESDLTLLPMLDQRLTLTGPLVNPFVNTTNTSALHPTNGVIIVTRVDGPTPQIAMGLVDKALEAEKNGLWGNVYVDTRGATDAAMKMGDEMLKNAGELARMYGYEVITEPSSRTFSPSTPLSDIAFYFGWYDQNVSGPFTNDMVTFRPGAIAYHLHSFSSRQLRVTNAWWTGPLLAAGATATLGCTEEPYLQSTPHMNSLFYRFVNLGFTFGEAALAAQPWLSWQITVIGDPLYRPFTKSQKERFDELAARRDKNLEWSVLMWINFLQSKNATLDELLKVYKDNESIKESPLLQEKLGDIYKSKGKLIDALDPYATALKGDLGRLQRLRVTLKAAPLFSSMGRAEQAYELYRGLLRDFPEYPNKKELFEKLAAVASRLKKTEEAAEYQRLAKEAAL